MPIAEAMSSLHHIEATHGAGVHDSSPAALLAARRALAQLQSKQGDAEGKMQVQNQKAMENREAHQAHMLENQQKISEASKIVPMTPEQAEKAKTDLTQAES